MTRTTALKQILDIADKVPKIVLQDINQRISDWLVMGGNEDDPYIYQQLRFAEKFVEEA